MADTKRGEGSPGGYINRCTKALVDRKISTSPLLSHNPCQMPDTSDGQHATRREQKSRGLTVERHDDEV